MLRKCYASLLRRDAKAAGQGLKFFFYPLPRLSPPFLLIPPQEAISMLLRCIARGIRRREAPKILFYKKKINFFF